jgi:hypothetical protein
MTKIIADANKIVIAELDRVAAALRRAQTLAPGLGLTEQLRETLADVEKIKADVKGRQ